MNNRKTARLLTFAVLSAAAFLASASDGWTQTGKGPDPSDPTQTATTTEYVAPSSIKSIRGNYRTAFVKTVFTPPVPGLGAGPAAALTISAVMVGCNDLSWGTANSMTFDPNMVPIMSTSGEYDKTNPVWTLKDMGPLDESSVTYKTGKFICSAKP